MKKVNYEFTKEQEREYMGYVMGSAYCFPDEKIMSIEDYYKVGNIKKRVPRQSVLSMLKRRVLIHG
jgi:hypothetical protein